MKMKLLFNTIIALILTAQVAFACERGFNSLTAISPNGRYTAKSILPEGFNNYNPNKPIKIILIDNIENSILWSIPFPKEIKAPPPTEIYPTNQGNIVICGIDEYYAFDKDGKPHYLIRLNTEVGKLRETNYCQMSTLGRHCDRFQKVGQFNHQGNEYFYISLYWGRIFVIDISKAQLATREEIKQLAIENIISDTVDFIKNYSGQYTSLNKRSGNQYLNKDLLPYVFISKQYDIKEGKELVATFGKVTLVEDQYLRTIFDKVLKAR